MTVSKWIGPALMAVMAVLAEVALGRAAGGPDVAFFLGRFHPLVVHLPIGFFLLVAAGEAATFHPQLRPRVEPVLGLLVPLSAAAALAAFLMGQLLALEGGFPAQALTWHRRLTLLAVIGMAACWVAYERAQRSGHGRWLYRGVMGGTLGLLSLGAHFGGTMTRGEAYLSKYAPGPLKPLLGSSEPEAKTGPAPVAPAGPEPLVFAHVVQPILNQYCVECHGAEKQKGKLRVDSLEQLMKGGEGGASVVPGSAAKSALLSRMLLPLTDDDRMPPEGKPSPRPEELALLEFWLDRGASPTLKVKDVLAPVVSRALLERAAGATSPPTQLPGASAASSSDATASSDAAPASDAAPTPGTSPASATGASPTPVSTSEAAPPGDGGTALASAVASGVAPAAFLGTYSVKCHGAQKAKGKLRVDSTAALLKGGAEGPALVPGRPEQSSVVTRVRLPLSSDEHMPPAKEPQPSAAEVAAFAAWIRAGGPTSAASTTSTASPTQPATATAALTPSATSGGAPDGAAAASTVSEPTESVPAAEPVRKPADPEEPVAPSVKGPADPALLKSLPSRVALFQEAVQPLLAEKCGKCHIKEKPAGGLDVSKLAALLEGGYSGPGVIAKDRSGSPLFARLILPSTDDERMPPEGEPTLSADEVELIGAWIDGGAPAATPTEVATLPVGAVRALAALGVKGAPEPEPLAPRSGGCAACSVPGARSSGWLAAQAATLFGAALLFAARRARRRH